jgi:hypothetical protein
VLAADAALDNWEKPLKHRMTGSITRAAFCALFVSLPSGAHSEPTRAASNSAFLSSVGVVSTFPDRGQPLDKTIEMIRYGGFRWVRTGIEGLTEEGKTTIQTFLDLHRETGVRFSWGLVSGGTDIPKLVETAKTLVRVDALLAIEGSNEPNNWGVTYNGERGGGNASSWMAVAKLQRDLYKAVKGDPTLAKYPVWSISEAGAQRDNVGLQFLKIPPGANTLMPEGTVYADVANVHNYIYHRHSPYLADNQVWNASDITSASKVDGLFGNFGLTWSRGYRGYSQQELNDLSRVTTETGAVIDGQVTEDMHGRHLMHIYLAQFAQGYAHTAVYLLRDRTDERGNQTFGFFALDYSPRKAAHYLHNLMAILADDRERASTDRLDYAIVERSKTIHDLLLQRSDGTFQLVIWSERVEGDESVALKFGAKLASLAIYNPIIGLDPIDQKINVSDVTVSLGHHPLIFNISVAP